jgi:hypothetical protein
MEFAIFERICGAGVAIAMPEGSIEVGEIQFGQSIIALGNLVRFRGVLSRV